MKQDWGLNNPDTDTRAKGKPPADLRMTLSKVKHHTPILFLSWTGKIDTECKQDVTKMPVEMMEHSKV